MNQRIEEMLKKEHEGRVFAHVYLRQDFGTFWATREYYTVKDGVVYLIEKSGLTASGDSVFDTATNCILVGRYNPKFKYKRTTKKYNYREMVNLLKL